MKPGPLTGRTASAGGQLIEGYEALRRQVLDREANRGWGLALFLNRGMAAWASARASCAVTLEELVLGRPEPAASPRARLPQRREELVGVLCAMVWACQREVAA